MLAAFGPAPAIAQTATMTMGAAPPGKVEATMSTGANGMAMTVATGGRSMTMNLGDPPSTPGTPSPGPGGPTGPATASPLSPSSVAVTGAGVAIGDRDADYRRCLRRAEQRSGGERDRMRQRCRGVR